MLTNEQIASITHAANRAYRVVIGEDPGPEWADLDAEQQQGVINGVVKAPTTSPSRLHDEWANEKTEAGWVYGAEKNVEARTHPQLVPYDQLPEEQRRKDMLFRGVVTGLVRPIVYDHRVIGMDAADTDSGEYIDLRLSPMTVIDVVSSLVDTLRVNVQEVPVVSVKALQTEDAEVQA